MLRFNQIRRLAYNLKQGKKFIPQLDKIPEFEKGKRFEFMKEEYGPEYKTFDEKYDLHVPKSEYEGKKSLRERFLEQDDNKKTKKIMALILLCVFISCNQAYGTM